MKKLEQFRNQVLAREGLQHIKGGSTWSCTTADGGTASIQANSAVEVVDAMEANGFTSCAETGGRGGGSVSDGSDSGSNAGGGIK